jgi:hypothetical protein
MLDGRSSAFAFGPFRLFVLERRLEKDGEPVRLGGRAFRSQVDGVGGTATHGL